MAKMIEYLAGIETIVSFFSVFVAFGVSIRRGDIRIFPGKESIEKIRLNHQI